MLNIEGIEPSAVSLRGKWSTIDLYATYLEERPQRTITFWATVYASPNVFHLPITQPIFWIPDLLLNRRPKTHQSA